jgi:hypothetical protein
MKIIKNKNKYKKESGIIGSYDDSCNEENDAKINAKYFEKVKDLIIEEKCT